MIKSLTITLLLILFSFPAFSQDNLGGANAEPINHFSFVRFRSDLQVNADATSVDTQEYEILLKTKAGVDQWSQVRLTYSEKMETLEVLSAYTLTPDGQRHDVPADKIYSQESYSSSSAPLYADHKVKVIVFPQLVPGSRLVYSVRQARTAPYFPGHFSWWVTFSKLTEYGDAQVTLTAPKDLPLHVYARGVQGGEQQPVMEGNAKRWSWRHQNLYPMQEQSLSTAAWDYSPTIMVSTNAQWGELGRAYQVKAGEAAKVTPTVQAKADEITRGMTDRRAQAAALYEWVARNIRYVAVYLGNGGLEPNSAASILAHQYGDCKDHTALLQALLAAKGIDSTAVLVGADRGPTLPPVPVLGRFNHAISYLPEFDLYLDSTSPYARFGQLPSGVQGVPVVLAAQGRLARTPPHDPKVNTSSMKASFHFSRNGDVAGTATFGGGAHVEIKRRELLSQVTGQYRSRVEDALLAAAGFEGSGKMRLMGDPLDLSRPFSYVYQFEAKDFVDFSMAGGMALPLPPGSTDKNPMRDLYKFAMATNNLTPFYCDERLFVEEYEFNFVPGVPILAIPKSMKYSNPAGEYVAEWRQAGREVSVAHRLRLRAVNGVGKLCEPADYPALRELLQQVRRGFRGQIVYGAFEAPAAQ